MEDAFYISETYFPDNFILKSTIEPEIVLIISFYLLFNSFVSELAMQAYSFYHTDENKNMSLTISRSN